MRINKYLSDAGYCSRRQADKLVQEGKVEINGDIAGLGDQVQQGDDVSVEGKKIRQNTKKVYLAYHKPVGVICTADLGAKDNIIEAVGYPQRVYPIGRLDVESSGLILLTNDGSIVNDILRAHKKCEKEYIVSVNKKITQDFLKQMSDGVKILGRRTMHAKVKKINDYTFSIVLMQGLNRQIRRMCESLRYDVKRLKRIRIKNIKLGDLPVGKYKEIKKPV